MQGQGAEGTELATSRMPPAILSIARFYLTANCVILQTALQ